MHFGKKLLETRYEPWAFYYLDYSELKVILEQDANNDQLAALHHNTPSTTTLGRFTSSLRYSFRDTTLRFQTELDHQVNRVVLFFLRQQGVIADRISRLVEAEEPPSDLNEQLQSSATDLWHLIEYVDMNVTAIRKILKKHDRAVRGRRVLSNRYLFPTSQHHLELLPLLEYGGIDSMIQTVQDLWQDHALFLEVGGDVEDNGYGSTTNATLSVQNDSILRSILAARQNLQSTSEFVDMLAAQMLVSTEEETSQEGRLYEKRRLSNWLNFCSTFLHLTDYYVVAPGCGSYAAMMAGGDESLAGMIIGMNSVAALISTLIYSWWTSWSYRGPLICATTCQIVGDVVYALALPLGGSLRMVMLGRLISGFGSARALNRRYIADTFAPKERTAASAAFVTAGALGTSAGPALAAGLYALVPDASKSPYWRVENAPCWVMVVVWFIYLALIIRYFEEPERPDQEAKEGKTKIELSVHHDEVKGLVSERPTVNVFAQSTNADTETQPLWRNVPVMITFLIYFVLKFILESLLSSTAVLSGYYFNWNDGQSGSYLAVLGLLVLPANWVVARVAQRYDDRELIIAIEVCMLFGCLAILDYTTTYKATQYIFASCSIFVATNALEGPTMSLLSKSIPKYYRRGFWNVGLLATESGTLGRAVGDVILTMCGASGLQFILNNAFSAMSALSVVCILVTLYFYKSLSPREKDD